LSHRKSSYRYNRVYIWVITFSRYRAGLLLVFDVIPGIKRFEDEAGLRIKGHVFKNIQVRFGWPPPLRTIGYQVAFA
jgi:hypothetical protein